MKKRKKERKKETKRRRKERKRKAGEHEFVLSSPGALGHWPRFKGKAIVPTSRSVNPLINHRRGRLFESKDKSALAPQNFFAKLALSFSLLEFDRVHSRALFAPRGGEKEVPFRFLCPHLYVRSFVRGFVLISPPVGFAQTRVSSSTWPFIKLSKRKSAFEKKINKKKIKKNERK